MQRFALVLVLICLNGCTTLPTVDEKSIVRAVGATVDAVNAITEVERLLDEYPGVDLKSME